MSSSIMLQVLSPLGVEPVNLTMDENPEVILLVADVILWPSRYLGIKSRSNRVYKAIDKLVNVKPIEARIIKLAPMLLHNFLEMGKLDDFLNPV